MMQHAHTPDQARTRLEFASDGYAPVRGHAAQHVTTTASRRTRRSDFLRAATWSISRGLHPRANATTLRVAHDLANRLNSDGHVAYSRDSMWKRLAISRRTLERHVAVLRELGLLAWAVHGTRTNTRPAGSGEWAGTATIYAAVVPRAWDDAVGHRVCGHGYHARHIGFTDRGRALAIADARRREQSAKRRDTPSWRSNHPRPQAERGEKKKDTCAPHHALPQRRRHEAPEPYRASPEEAAHAVSVAAWVRPRVPWIQAASLRRLAFALRPWIRSGHSAPEIAAVLTLWRVPQRPASPVGVLMTRWRDLAGQPPSPAPLPKASECSGAPPNQAFLTAMDRVRTDVQILDPSDQPQTDPPGFVIRGRILASLAQAERDRRARTAEECTFAEWELVCDERERFPW